MLGADRAGPAQYPRWDTFGGSIFGRSRSGLAVRATSSELTEEETETKRTGRCECEVRYGRPRPWTLDCVCRIWMSRDRPMDGRMILYCITQPWQVRVSARATHHVALSGSTVPALSLGYTGGLGRRKGICKKILAKRFLIARNRDGRRRLNSVCSCLGLMFL